MTVSPETLIATIAVVAGVLTMVLSFMSYLRASRKDTNDKWIELTKNMSAMETKVNTMWDFQMRRAMGEAVRHELGKMESPLTFYPDSIRLLDPIRDRLVRFWNGEGAGLDDGEALIRLEQLFGEELMHLVCVPSGLSHGACLLLALAVARQTHIVDLKLGTTVLAGDAPPSPPA